MIPYFTTIPYLLPGTHRKKQIKICTIKNCTTIPSDSLFHMNWRLDARCTQSKQIENLLFCHTQFSSLTGRSTTGGVTSCGDSAAASVRRFVCLSVARSHRLFRQNWIILCVTRCLYQMVSQKTLRTSEGRKVKFATVVPGTFE